MVIEIDERILDRGNNILIKKNKNGDIVMLKVEMTIVQRVGK